MAECIQCGAYTKFNGGLCLKCYKAEQKEIDEIIDFCDLAVKFFENV